MLNRVTITGASNDTPPQALVDLSEEFPFVEWGILMSKSGIEENKPRYPNHDWVDALHENTIGKPVQVSTHLCGRWAQDFFKGVINWVDIPNVWKFASRLQINGTPISGQFPLCPGLFQFIFQYPRAGGYMMGLRKLGVNVVPLFDDSGGRGVKRKEWPEPLEGLYCGYAGGLGSDNVVEEVLKIEDVCKQPFWIDMENNVRTDDNLDLKKVRRVLELCKPLIVG